MILNDQQFQKLKQGFQTGAKTLGVMGDQAFQGLRKTVSQMPISKLAQGDLQGYAQSLKQSAEQFKDPMTALNFVTPGAGIIKSVSTKVGQEALKDSVYNGLKKLKFPATMKNPIEHFETQMNVMGKIEKGTHTADDLRSGSELIKLMESKPSSPLAQEVGKVGEFKLDREYVVEGNKFDEYFLNGDKRKGQITVDKNPKLGWRIRNVFVDDGATISGTPNNPNLQRKGLATRAYEDLNRLSIKETGKPLRSSEIFGAKNKTGFTTLNEAGQKLWKNLVKLGKAELVDNLYYRFKK